MGWNYNFVFFFGGGGGSLIGGGDLVMSLTDGGGAPIMENPDQDLPTTIYRTK